MYAVVDELRGQQSPSEEGGICKRVGKKEKGLKTIRFETLFAVTSVVCVVMIVGMILYYWKGIRQHRVGAAATARATVSRNNEPNANVTIDAVELGQIENETHAIVTIDAVELGQIDIRTLRRLRDGSVR